MIEPPDGERPVIVIHYFQRMPIVGDSLVYDLDVSKMDPGLHTLTYQVRGRLQTAPLC